jgi:transposase-like protein
MSKLYSLEFINKVVSEAEARPNSVSVESIAIKYDIPSTTLWTWLSKKRKGIKIRPGRSVPRYSNGFKNKVRKYAVDNCESHTQIANHFGISVNTVRAWTKRSNLKKKPVEKPLYINVLDEKDLFNTSEKIDFMNWKRGRSSPDGKIFDNTPPVSKKLPSPWRIDPIDASTWLLFLTILIFAVLLFRVLISF